MTPITTATPEQPNLDRVRAVSYGRQSRRREDDSQASPEAQHAKCEALMTARGWEVSGHFADIGKSGWDPNVTRPGFDELMEAVRAQHVDAVIVFSLSRLTRRGALEAMTIIEELRRHGVTLVSVEEPYLDTSTPVGVGILTIIAGLAQQESDLKSSYIRGSKEAARKAGGHDGGVPPYGFQATREQRGKLTVNRLVSDPIEAPHVRDMATWAQEGVAANEIARRLNNAGVPTKYTNLGDMGKRRLDSRRKRSASGVSDSPAWTSTAVLRTLRDPRLAGFAVEWDTSDGGSRPRKRVPLRDDEGKPVESHEQIIEPADWWALQDVLAGRTPVVKHDGHRVPSLLAGHGILFCALCDSVMVVGHAQGRMLYRCARNTPGDAGKHGGLSIDAATADDAVARRVWNRLTAMDPADEEDREWLAEAARRFARQRDDSGREADLAAVRAELEHTRDSLRTLYEDRQASVYAGTVGTEMFRESVARMNAQEERLSERLRELESADNTATQLPSEWTDPGDDPLGPESPWHQWDLNMRRELLAVFVDAVRVTKAKARGRYARTAERVTITWAELPHDT